MTNDWLTLSERQVAEDACEIASEWRVEARYGQEPRFYRQDGTEVSMLSLSAFAKQALEGLKKALKQLDDLDAILDKMDCRMCVRGHKELVFFREESERDEYEKSGEYIHTGLPNPDKVCAMCGGSGKLSDAINNGWSP